MGIIALDEVLDYGYDTQPLDENRVAIDDWRAIGLGFFGIGDMLIALGLRYGSQESIVVASNIAECMLKTALETSAELAKTKGTFGKYDWNYIKESPLIKMYEGTPLYNNIKKYGLRNGNLLSVAPTGTLSTMCGITGGAEPAFAISYQRTTHSLSDKKQYFKVFAKSVYDLLLYNNINPESITNEEIQAKFPYVVASHDIKPLDRVSFQAAIQKYVDNAISSTVNLKHEATVQDVFDLYLKGWELRCKGLTVFRDGCKRTAILTTSPDQDEPKETKLDSITPIKRGDIKEIQGKTIVGSTACVNHLYTTVNVVDGDIFEVFTNVSQGCKSNIGTITRLVSLALRSGVKAEEVISELKANICPACQVLKRQGKDVNMSCGNAIADAIEKVYKNLKQPIEKESNLSPCPECGEKTLRPEGRCVTCSNCGWSKCE